MILGVAKLRSFDIIQRRRNIYIVNAKGKIKEKRLALCYSKFHALTIIRQTIIALLYIKHCDAVITEAML